MRLTSILCAALALAGCATTVTVGQQPGRVEAEHHPSYLRALADLRQSRAHLDRLNAPTMAVSWDETVAIREIDEAMRAIREASIDDGKNLNDHPPVDAGLDWPGRLHRTLELLHAARRDCEQEEDNGFARGLRQRALQHIDAAIRYVEQGIADHYPQRAGLPPPPPAGHSVVAVGAAPGNHPAYLQALSDLRLARAHLQRPAGANMFVAFDESVAVREIDAAMHAILEASIDDGKNLGDHPPVDARLDWPGRLHRTVELLMGAQRDCNKEEDNAFAQGLKRRALGHINAALAYVQKGISDNNF